MLVRRPVSALLSPVLAAGIRGDYAQAPAGRNSEIISGNAIGGRSDGPLLASRRRVLVYFRAEETQLTTLRYLLPGLLLFVFVACGSSEGAAAQRESFQKVTSSEQLFTIDNFSPIRFKVSKEYNVEGLTAATGAWFGFWRPEGSDAKEFEIRFYSSHEEAVQFGMPFADEATGEDAVLDEDEATWKEGIKDRRYFFAGLLGTHGSGSVQAKYGGYAIYGNMILLCEGANAEHSLGRCASLVDALLLAGSQ